jgi:hypothetical protein
MSVWVDRWDIPATANWNKAIDDALDSCDVFLIVLSEASVASDEVEGELRTALDDKKTILPVLHQNCKIPRQLRVIQHIDFTDADPDNERLLQEIEDAVGIGVRSEIEGRVSTPVQAPAKPGKGEVGTPMVRDLSASAGMARPMNGHLVKHEIFISYSKADKKVADKVVQALEETGHPCWIAPRDARLGGFDEMFKQTIRDAWLFIVIVSRSSAGLAGLHDSTKFKGSKHVKSETKYAFDNKRDDQILPLRLDDANGLDYYVGAMHQVKVRDNDLDRAIRELVTVVQASSRRIE